MTALIIIILMLPQAPSKPPTPSPRLTYKRMTDPHRTVKFSDGAVVTCITCVKPDTAGQPCKDGGTGAEAHLSSGQWLCY